MTAFLPASIRSLHQFWWDAVGYLAGSAWQRLGLHPVIAKPFMTRRDRQALTRTVTLLEAVLRRLFFIEAADAGPLPQTPSGEETPSGEAPPLGKVPPPASAPPGRAAQRPAASPPRTPHFRLMEAFAARAARPRKTYRTGPAIRFLDEDRPVDLRDYPADPTDILPSGDLIRRLQAINHAIDFPDIYVRRMRKLMARERPVLKSALPSVFRSRTLPPLQQESARALHQTTRDLAVNDTS